MNTEKILIFFAVLLGIGLSVFCKAEAKTAGDNSLLHYMIDRRIAKVCVELSVNPEGEKSIAISSGSLKIDKMVLESIEADRLFADALKSLDSDQSDRKMIPLEIDLSSEFKHGKTYCAPKGLTPTS